MTSDAAHANRLIDATSPYLLQHAHNPVDWWPWCDEALELARAQDKPILSTSRWTVRSARTSTRSTRLPISY